MSGILDNIGWIGCACQRGFHIRDHAAARTRKIFRCFASIFRKTPGPLTAAAIGIQHPRPTFDGIPQLLKSWETKKHMAIPTLDGAAIFAQLAEPNHNSVMEPEVAGLCPICNFP
ncbi:hypothetical protein [Bradyrhizobium sp.]|uniref:hypothetical protein n=1 Tax=Bradyrhizobium sp. TaxID=376 RepID=UPI003D0B0D35